MSISTFLWFRNLEVYREFKLEIQINTKRWNGTGKWRQDAASSCLHLQFETDQYDFNTVRKHGQTPQSVQLP